MMKAQEVAASERTADLQAVVRGLQKEIQQLYDAKMEGEGAVKHEMANSRERENVLKTRLTELQSTIFQLEASKQDEADASLALEKRAVSELEARVQALTEEKEEMVERQRSFRQRYQAGTLVSIVQSRLSLPY
jgi:chromosome segregation ATPase